MIKMQEAMEIAKNFITNYGGRKQGFLLEEAYLSEEKKTWKITYSFFQKTDALNALQEMAGIEGRRVYRTVEIDNESGEVVSMKAGFGSNLGAIA